MATRTITRPAQAATSKRSKAFNAKCEVNQPLVDLIAEKRERVQNSNYSFTLKKAMDSLCKSKEPITTYKEALALSGIGPSIASILFHKEVLANKNKPSVAGRGRKTTQKAATSKTTTNHETAATLKDAPTFNSPGAATSNLTETAHVPAKERLQELLQAKEAPSRKETAYQKAVKESENWKGRQLTWRLVLLIDRRERKAEHYASKIQQCGIPTDIRQLPIGDMTWIAQGSVPGTEKVAAELLLGTIIERKEVSDLKSSLFGTRYNEQQLRLKCCGQPQVIFLVEGDIKKDLYRCPSETLHSVLWNIRIDKGNQVVQTAHMEDTVHTLRRMHRRMLKRTFPTAFYAEALPTFAGPDVGGSRTSISSSRSRDSFGEQRRRRRRRLESLHGLTFDEEPIPMAGMDRFTSYKELCAKIERDRESGRRTIGGIHQAMLKQVASISDTKIAAICEEYPTATSILKAYDNAGSHEQGKLLLQSIALQSMGGGTSTKSTTAVGKRTLGARSAAELYIVYGLRQGTYDSGNEDSDPSPSTNNYTTLVQAALEKRRTSDNFGQLASGLPNPMGEDDNADVFQQALAASLEQTQTQRPKPVAAAATATQKRDKPSTTTTYNIADSSSSDDDDDLFASVLTQKKPAAKKRKPPPPPPAHEVIEID